MHNVGRKIFLLCVGVRKHVARVALASGASFHDTTFNQLPGSLLLSKRMLLRTAFALDHHRLKWKANVLYHSSES